MLVNLALAASAGAFARMLAGEPLRLLDPTGGLGTTLNRWLKDKRMKHTVTKATLRKGHPSTAHRMTVTDRTPGPGGSARAGPCGSSRAGASGAVRPPPPRGGGRVGLESSHSAARAAGGCGRRGRVHGGTQGRRGLRPPGGSIHYPGCAGGGSSVPLMTYMAPARVVSPLAKEAKAWC
ncbi:MAG: hypothetical protein EXQ71_09065 [Acidimicrobiia bacterium]|nr:hypothetical protein [Acidimicrobiia bacterium]